MRRGSGAMWAALLLLLAALPAAGADGPAVDLVNASFEEDADGDGIPDGWAQAGCEMPQRVALDTKTKKDGVRSFCLESLTKPTDNTFGQMIRVEPRALYRLSAWIRTKDFKAGEGVHFCAAVAARVGRNGKVIARSDSHVGTTDWTLDAVDFIAPANGQVLISCEYSSWGRSTGAVWYDGLRVQRLAGPDGLAALPEAPRGCAVRAKWALQQNPPDWAMVAEALDRHYRTPAGRAADQVHKALSALALAAEANPKARAALVKLFARQAWRIDFIALDGRDVGPLLRQAIEQAGRDPKAASLAGSARLGMARLTAVYGTEAPDAAAQALRQAVAMQKGARASLVNTLLADALHLRRKKLSNRAARVHAILLAFLEPADPLRPRVEADRLDHVLALGDREAAQAIAQALVDPKRKVPPDIRKAALLALCKTSRVVGGTQGAAHWLARADKELGNNRGQRGAFRLDLARGLTKDGRWAEAVPICRHLLAAFPDQIPACFEAQTLLARSLLELDRTEEALAAAKVLFDAAPNSEEHVTTAVDLVMRALRARHGSIAPCNEFILFQSHGPNGRDGKPGTDDDPDNPLAKVACTPPADVEALFRQTLAGLGADLAGRRWRGYLHLYWGKGELALREFVWRYDHAPIEQKTIDEAIDDVVVGLKAHFGHTLAGEQFVEYQKFGPKGRDGTLGTADDLEDPLASLRARP